MSQFSYLKPYVTVILTYRVVESIRVYTHKLLLILSDRDPGGPVIKTPYFQCRRQRVQSLVRELRSHMPYGVIKKKQHY